MVVTETSADGLKREFKVVIDKQDIESRIEGRLDELKKTVRLPGFRPGKVPVSLLRKRYSDSVRSQILEDAVSQSSAQALAEKGLRAAMPPKVEVVRFEEGDDLEYTLAVEVMPDVVPGDFRKLKLMREVVEVADQEVADMIERLAASQKRFVPVEEHRAAEPGDALVIDFAGKVDGVAFEGLTGTDHVLQLGSSTFIAGFEDQLVGAEPGDHVDVKITFPKEYVNDELAGKDAVFAVDVKEIQKVEPVAVDDAFARSQGFDDLAAVRAKIKEQLDGDYRVVSRAKLKRALLDELSEEYDFPVPPGMVDVEFESIWKQVTDEKAENPQDPSDADRGDDELRAEYRTIAERRVRLGLLLSEVGRLNNITVERDELDQAIIERARRFSGQEDKVAQYYHQNPAALNELRAPLFEDKVVDFILELADVSDETVSVEKLIRESDGDGGTAGGDETAAETEPT